MKACGLVLCQSGAFERTLGGCVCARTWKACANRNIWQLSNCSMMSRQLRKWWTKQASKLPPHPDSPGQRHFLRGHFRSANASSLRPMFFCKWSLHVSRAVVPRLSWHENTPGCLLSVDSQALQPGGWKWVGRLWEWDWGTRIFRGPSTLTNPAVGLVLHRLFTLKGGAILPV